MSEIKRGCTASGCCLHDSRTKEFYCVAETYSGERCSKHASKDTPYCKLHIHRCLDIYLQYKKVCAPLWTDKKRGLVHTLSDEQLFDNIRIGTECARLRITHFNECFKRSVEDKMDVSHEHAIVHAMEIVQASKAELYKRGRIPKR